MEPEVAHNTVASCVQKDPYSEISFPRLLFQRGSKCSGLDRKHQNLQIRPSLAELLFLLLIDELVELSCVS